MDLGTARFIGRLGRKRNQWWLLLVEVIARRRCEIDTDAAVMHRPARVAWTATDHTGRDP
jgi:hypothetical protein